MSVLKELCVLVTYGCRKVRILKGETSRLYIHLVWGQRVRKAELGFAGRTAPDITRETPPLPLPSQGVQWPEMIRRYPAYETCKGYWTAGKVGGANNSERRIRREYGPMVPRLEVIYIRGSSTAQASIEMVHMRTTCSLKELDNQRGREFV